MELPDTEDRLKTATPEAIAEAAEAIGAGRLVAFPTETVYGFGCDARNDAAVAAVYDAKQRPQFNPLIIHFTDQQSAMDAVVFNDIATKLSDAFWPGALTLVLPRSEDCTVSLLASAGLDTLAVRVPNHPIAHTLIEASGSPIAAPSANRSGEISPTTAGHVLDGLGDAVDIILDGGPCTVGLESTVVDLSTDAPTLLRPGGICQEDIEDIIGPLAIAGSDDDAPKSPGQMSRHYAPRIPLRLNAETANTGEALLAFGSGAKRRAANLSRSGDLKEAAANLFAMIRMLDQPGFNGIAVMPIPDEGLGRAINDRLKRACTK
ncbi:MAG: threonylcarbamoyl-AMP synthase [Rhodospirillaceae bacterium]|nr:threonylcarbamoyl-AMP synthase [Rhodospirillaceae bacterium]MBT4463561.1 threonylcarbamoyl-AMP synthase [Rhodospirillaceae bacterium]MBT5014727.1 threonylcarbamoyl-AMP synthase [Rhodospirillaceae bacterium]MBT5309443.1 threonylcarbamoyl-AMP synthase [Rhodospirillaceae bacterium]MBT6407170.1 threonylcarbamoyl-AMP synthase [Rhodospirillaceae bacterium]